MTVNTEDGHQKKTKLERIGERAKHRPDTVFNNIGHVIDLDLLRECYRELDGKKAIGTDGVTKAAYGEKLEGNLQALLARLHKRAYKPQASRLVEIPKEDGSTRPLAISCFEDKIVQLAMSKILTAVFEPEFLPCSYGYREGVNGHEALRALMKHSNANPDGITIEIDLRKYFNSIPHHHLMEILEKKISDKYILRLAFRLMRSPMMVNGKAELNKVGCPQGSIVAPVLSNIYLNYVIDNWFAKIRENHFRGRAEMVRFADDMVFVFQIKDDAERFYKVLPKRLEKYGLTLHEEKSSMIRSGSKAAAEAEKRGERLPTYKFLGFTCYWGKSRNGWFRLKYKSRSDRFAGKLNGLRKHLKENLNQKTHIILEQVKRIVMGWANYHAISDNRGQVEAFIHWSKRALFGWINRKGGRRKMSWIKFEELMERVNYPKSFRTTSMFTTR
ncbi:MAG: group II intron reverse transcriptase/maturase [Gammaproteobacteria bacterium]